MRSYPNMTEFMEVLPILKDAVDGGSSPPTRDVVQAAYIAEGFVLSQGMGLFTNPGVVSLGEACDFARSQNHHLMLSDATIAKIGDGSFLKKWGPVLIPLLLQLLKGV